MASRGPRLTFPLSDLLRRLSDSGRIFIELYDHRKERMQAIADELREIAAKINEIQKNTNMTRMMGAVSVGLGIVAAAAALLAGGLSGAVRMAIVGGAAAVGGGAAAITANATQLETEKINLETVERLGREFMTKVKKLKDVLEEIKALSEELEEKLSSLLTTTREQARRGLSETRQLQQLLRRTAQQAGNSREVMGATLTQVRELLTFNITRITSTPESDAKLRTCITECALQCEKTVHEFAKMRNTLKDFEEMQAK